MTQVVLSPFSLLFFSVGAGILVGKLRVRGISCGIAGILFVSLVLGALLRVLPATDAEKAEIRQTMRILSNLGSALFVSVIGLQTGRSLDGNVRKASGALFVGAAMSTAGTGAMLLISALNRAVGIPLLLGVLCGALTSTPGLSGVCERLGEGSGAAVLGYGCAYLPGVLLTVASAQFLCGNGRGRVKNSPPQKEEKQRNGTTLLPVAVTAFFGNLLGKKALPGLHLSPGTTATTLLFGVLLGYTVKKVSRGKTVCDDLDTCKTVGLALFFSGTGIPAGMQVSRAGAKPVLYGILITLAALLCGALLGKILLPKNRTGRGFLVAGGMTSSPAYGAIAAGKNDTCVTYFSFAYFGALLTLTLAVRFLTA